ncbi:MAG: hypothetical protein IPH05_00200 [Flavobacteriales bacterium]|nr:hypothetical protein [Flavobacteriales bacterium]
MAQLELDTFADLGQALSQGLRNGARPLADRRALFRRGRTLPRGLRGERTRRGAVRLAHPDLSYLGTGNLLGIGERTVETHVRSLLKKYHQPNRLSWLAFMMQQR